MYIVLPIKKHVISVVGNGIKWGAKGAANAVKIADTIKAGSRIIGNASALILSGSQAVETVKNIHTAYVETGEIFSWGNAKEFITLGLSVAGMGLAGSSIAKSGKSLKAMWQGGNVVQSAAVSNATKKVAGGSEATGQHKSKTLVTHRGTNEHIKEVLEQGYIKAYGPRTTADKLIDHNGLAVWVTEGKATWFNRIFSGMHGKKGEASITFEVDSSLLKRPNGAVKRWFGKIQRVIEEDVMLPEDVIIKYGGRK